MEAFVRYECVWNANQTGSAQGGLNRGEKCCNAKMTVF